MHLLIIHSTCSGADGSITISSINGGTSPYTYSWNNSAYTSATAISFLQSDMYTLDVTDANNCNSITQYYQVGEQNCVNFSGTIYYDLNTNCVFDAGDIPAKNIVLYASHQNGENFFGDTDASGNYSISAPYYGTYTVLLQNMNSTFNITNCGAPYTTSVSSLTPSANNNFFIQNNGSCALYSSEAFTNVNPGFQSILYTYIINQSLINTSGFLTYTLPVGLSYISSNPVPVSTNGNSLVFSYNNLSYLTDYFSTYIIDFLPATSLTIGSTLFATLTYDVNCTNVYSYSNPNIHPIFVTGPYDPNHKMVWPSQNGYEGDILLTDTELTYKVEFQNIGTAPAVNVVVIDTLSPLLDETSIRQLAASHPNNFVYNSLSRQMQWRFNNINLPDSTSNQTSSIGYFIYKAKNAYPQLSPLERKYITFTSCSFVYQYSKL